jgi:t-SNARE complex subunit (syntaxin)
LNGTRSHARKKWRRAIIRVVRSGGVIIIWGIIIMIIIVVVVVVSVHSSEWETLMTLVL